MSDARRRARHASRTWPPAFLVLAALAGSAGSQEVDPAEPDCSELAALERLPADAVPPPRDHYLRVEELFLRLLAEWPARGVVTTAGQLSDLEQRLSERLQCLGAAEAVYRESLPRKGGDRRGVLFLGTDDPDSQVVPFLCLTVVEGRTLEPLFDRRPGAPLAAALLYQRKQAHQLGQRRLWHAHRTLHQVRKLIDAHLSAAGEQADTSSAATILALAAYALADLPYIRTMERGVETLHRALEIDAEHRLALYLAAHSEEKLADFRHARRHLETLEVLTDGDPEVRLRLAMNLTRLGKRELARKRFGELLATRPDWVAIVASQELAGLLAEDGRREEAAAVLERTLERFPGRAQLQLQLARVRHADWGASWPLVDRVLNGWDGDRGEPARIEYEREQGRWVRDALAALETALEEARRNVLAEVDRLRRRPRARRRLATEHVETLCRGSLPLRRLPDDPNGGPLAQGSPGAKR